MTGRAGTCLERQLTERTREGEGEGWSASLTRTEMLRSLGWVMARKRDGLEGRDAGERELFEQVYLETSVNMRRMDPLKPNVLCK